MDPHRDFLIEIVRSIVDKTKDKSLYEPGNSHGEGYRLAIYSVLHLIEVDAATWELSPSDVGLDGFSPDEWLLTGADYWSSTKVSR